MSHCFYLPLWRNVDSLALGASAVRRTGSSPVRGTEIYTIGQYLSN